MPLLTHLSLVKNFVRFRWAFPSSIYLDQVFGIAVSRFGAITGSFFQRSSSEIGKGEGR